MSDGIEKLREYAKNRWTEDKLTGEVMRVWYGRYTTGEEFDALADQIEREFHYAVDAAVEETEEFYRAKLAELDKRLMPPGMEWPPKDSEGEDLSIGDKAHFLRTEHDGDHEWHDVVTAFRHQGIEGEGDVWIVEGEHGEAFACDCTKLPEPDTQERIDDDATMPPRRYYAEKIDHDVDLKDDEEVFTAVALSLMSRQRELDAKTMGGAE